MIVNADHAKAHLAKSAAAVVVVMTAIEAADVADVMTAVVVDLHAMTNAQNNALKNVPTIAKVSRPLVKISQHHRQLLSAQFRPHRAVLKSLAWI